MKISERDIERLLLQLVDEGVASMHTEKGVRYYVGLDSDTYGLGLAVSDEKERSKV